MVLPGIFTVVASNKSRRSKCLSKSKGDEEKSTELRGTVELI